MKLSQQGSEDALVESCSSQEESFEASGEVVVVSAGNLDELDEGTARMRDSDMTFLKSPVREELQADEYFKKLWDPRAYSTNRAGFAPPPLHASREAQTTTS